ncbi:hypothetical protein ACOTH0_30845 [Achromobacter xylosoxidans]|uniref:hypothetical protein n=1 Tax=Alcaligenes xylosoxydans xylosoxydans TaxID=85698 RepID=UPI0013CB1D48|nr:hypothetical protein [Achromobacter xylosoxidans]MCH4571962.1 hypothetical protein [Achromobacter xylosoxidans]NEV03871.1 hypothetical protein [Achromobacter xylosoxidans]
MENHNDPKQVTRAHLFARIDATRLSHPGQEPAEGIQPAAEDPERSAEQADKK